MKTALKNQINGAARINMWETGKIIKRTASAFSITPMEISTREDGVKTGDTGKELSGLQILRTN